MNEAGFRVHLREAPMLVMLSKRSGGYAAFNRATFVREHGLGDAEAEALDAIVVLVGGYSNEIAQPEGESVPGLMRPPPRTETVWFVPFSWFAADDGDLPEDESGAA